MVTRASRRIVGTRCLLSARSAWRKPKPYTRKRTKRGRIASFTPWRNGIVEFDLSTPPVVEYHRRELIYMVDLTLEREVESHLFSLARAQGWGCEKFKPDLNSGMPDRLILLPDRRCIWVELKRPKGGRLSPLQRYQHKKLRNMGQDVRVVWTKEQADSLVEEIKSELSY